MTPLEYTIIFLFCFIIFHLVFDIFINSYKGKRGLVMLRCSMRDKGLTTNIALGIFVGSIISMFTVSNVSAVIAVMVSAILSFIAMIHENYKKIKKG